jgi:hypothetical protein
MLLTNEQALLVVLHFVCRVFGRAILVEIGDVQRQDVGLATLHEKRVTK